MSTQLATEVLPWRFFDVEVVVLQRLSPSLLRASFGGPDLDLFADNGFDQRIKVVFPLPELGFTTLPTGEDWYAAYLALPDHERNPVRTYTVRGVRHDRAGLSRVVVDFVLHGDTGPASAWAGGAAVGDRLVVLGPNAWVPHGGVEWSAPDGSILIVAGDETALPAIASIGERLPPDALGRVLMEVPGDVDFLELTLPDGVQVTWLARHGARQGTLLVPAVGQVARDLVELHGAAPGREAASPLEDVDVDHDILWEVPDDARPATLYAWLAGEAAMIRAMRRDLVQGVGLDRGQVAFMGYWRLGRREG